MPKLSIIIPVYNMNTQVNQCLSTIRRTVRLPYEVLVVDDGSSADERVVVPAAGDDVRVIRSATHRGFSHAVNMGIRASEGEVLLFLHADVLLAPHTAEDMLDALIENPMTGAVTAVAPYTYMRAQFLPTKDYRSWAEFVAVADEIRSGGGKPHPEILAEMIALMVRRDVAEEAGFLDEQYQMPAVAAYDYTIRMTSAGHAVVSLPNVYVHHEESGHGQERAESEQMLTQDNLIFRTKWGVSLDYSFNPRVDILSMMDLSREWLRVLEIGCACGATLREIGSRNPTARLYGVELNEHAAAIAAPFVQILTMNVEELDPADISERFDYIIMGDVIEHLLDPWSAIRNMRELLVPGGAIIASIPNVAHISNLYHVLCGRWTYEDMGLLDRTHFRFFTKYEIVQLFENAGFIVDETQPRKLPLDAQWQKFRDELLSLQTVHVNAEDLEAFQWFFRAMRE